MADRHFEVVIVGGGTGGISVAARLRAKGGFQSVALVEPSEVHYYQPLWTLVGGGVLGKESTRRRQADFIPKGTTWVRDAVASFSPEKNEIALKNGDRLTYGYLVVAVGMEVFWDRIPGLREALSTGSVCSNYSYETVEGTWKAIQAFRGGRALFTFPSTPIKCGGAPQKIMYLAESYFRKQGLRDKTEVVFFSAGASIFAVKKYAAVLNGIIAKRGLQTRYRYNLVEIRPKDRVAVFENLDTKDRTEERYDLMHVTPPMGTPAVVSSSALADGAGFVAVDKHTLQHVKFPNVFSLGDGSSLPTSRTGAAIRKQAPVLVGNLLAYATKRPLTAKYDGYTSCPLVTDYGKVVLAEFDYDGNPVETFPFDQGKERWSMYFLKRYLLPPLYWYGMLRGRA
jgi:sulfide:quinone oxidoreductase